MPKNIKLKYRIATLLTLQFVPVLADADLVTDSTAQRVRVQAGILNARHNFTITSLFKIARLFWLRAYFILDVALKLVN